MKIDLLKDKNNYIYVTHKDDTNLPSWYPVTGDLQYGVKSTINYTNAITPEPSEEGYYTFKGWNAVGGWDDYIWREILPEIAPSGDFSIAFWCNANGNTRVDKLIKYFSSIVELRIDSVNPNLLSFYIVGEGSVESSLELPTDSDWFSVACSYNKTTGVVNFYINAVKDLSVSGVAISGVDCISDFSIMYNDIEQDCGESLHHYILFDGELTQDDVTKFHNKDYDNIVTTKYIQYNMNEDVPDGDAPYTDYTIDSVNGYDASPSVLTADKDDFFHPEVIGEPSSVDISFIIGWETSNIIDNITLDIDSSSSYTAIHLMYSMDSWSDGFAEDPIKFDSVVWSPFTVNRTVWGPPITDVIVPKPIYLNATETLFKPIECKCLKITFTGCTDLILNSIEIEKDETININRLLLEPFVYEKYINDILKIYKDTDIESYTDHAIKMLDGYEEP